MNSLFPILAIVRKDISVWLRQPTSIAATVLPAIAFIVILYFGAQAVGRNPVALVVQDRGPLHSPWPAAITEFYAEKGNSSPIQIHVKETDLRSQDIDLLRFELVPNLVLLLTTAGIVNAGLATAREWEDSTIKELLLAPISKATLIAGKLLSGWITTLLIASLVLVVGAASGYLRHEDQNSIIPCHQIGKKTNFFTFLW